MTQTVTNINTQVILAESPTAAGVSSSVFILRAETFFLSVDISAISGTLDIKAETIDEATGELKEVITFDQFSAVTSELQFKTANYSLDKVKVTATYTDACTFRILAKGASSPTTIPYLIDEYGETGRMLSDNIFLGAPIVISPEHHEIHCGDSYEATSNFTLGNGATRDFLIIVPNEAGTGQSQKLYHMLGKIESAAEISATFYEGADRVAGTSVSSFNRNRNSSNTDTLGISHTPTGGTTDGTAIWGPWRVGTGRNMVGTLTRNNEFVLKNNTKYILKITNQTTSNNNVNVEFDYYVHPGV